MPFPSQGARYCGVKCRATAHTRTLRRFYETKRQAWRVWRLRKGCTSCGYKKSAAALDLHHVNGDKEKRFSVTMFGTKWFYKEAAKCVVLCANCHREKHEEEKIMENGDLPW